MSEAILIAVIAAVGSVLGQWLISREREIRLDERLKGVEAKLAVHNGYAEKFGAIQIDIAQIRKDIEYIGGK